MILFQNRGRSLWMPIMLLAFSFAPRLALSQPAVANSPIPDPEGVAPAASAPAQNGGEDTRIYGILPNYRMAEASAEFHPLTARQKLTIAKEDSLSGSSFALAGIMAGFSQLVGQNSDFGGGIKGYAHRYGAGLADQGIGNLMAEGVMPVILHEDPRYFRLGQGSAVHRTLYALSRVFVTRTDSGGSRFNFSEVGGNSAAVAISNAYYPSSRTVADNVEKLTMSIGTDALANVAKEFWPDFKHKALRKGTGAD